MKNLLTLTFALTIALTFSTSVRAQSPCDGVTMPAGTVCLSQQAANKAAENVRELDAVKNKITVLEAALAEKDRIIADNKTAANQNEADLKAALTKTQEKLATVTGKLIGAEENVVRFTGVIDVLLKNSRAKCLPFSVCIGR